MPFVMLQFCRHTNFPLTENVFVQSTLHFRIIFSIYNFTPIGWELNCLPDLPVAIQPNELAWITMSEKKQMFNFIPAVDQ